jgi:enediyne polyketide synthase
LRGLLARSLPAPSVVVTGRFGAAPTLRPETTEMPFLRFLERPRVVFPGVELVVDAELATDTDPYLDDHVVRGERLFPAVMGLEAMAQAARAVAGDAELVAFEDVRFDRPVAVPREGTTTIRLAALARGEGRVDVALRCSSTGFQVDHFRAAFRSGQRDPSSERPRSPCSIPDRSGPDVPLDPARDLYGTILFHEGRFRRLRAYRRLRATECVAEIEEDGTDDWFGRYMPPTLMLGDPAARDAVIHAVQACIPHRTILPIGVERLEVLGLPANGPRTVLARERSRNDDTFTYDLEVADVNGRTFERWDGLRLRAVQGHRPRGPWAVALLGPYLGRRVCELIPGAAISVVVRRDAAEGRRARARRSVAEAVGRPAVVRRRPDGKPEISGGRAVSLSHVGDLTMAVVGRGDLGCDVEMVRPRPESTWRDLLGAERLGLASLIASEAEEDLDSAATRVWAAGESLEKAGAMIRTPLVLAPARGEDGWVVLASGPLHVASGIIRVRGAAHPLAVAVVARSEHASL